MAVPDFDSEPEQHVEVLIFGLRPRHMNLCDVSRTKIEAYIEGQPPFRILSKNTDCDYCKEVMNEFFVEDSIKLKSAQR